MCKNENEQSIRLYTIIRWTHTSIMDETNTVLDRRLQSWPSEQLDGRPTWERGTSCAGAPVYCILTYWLSLRYRPVVHFQLNLITVKLWCFELCAFSWNDQTILSGILSKTLVCCN